MRIVTIAALHHPFENFMMEGFVKVGLHCTVAAYTELRISSLQHVEGREARLFSVGPTDKSDRFRNILAGFDKVRRVAIGAADIVAPVFAAFEIVSLLFTGVASQTRLRDLLG